MYRFARWVVMVASITNVVVAAATLVVTWKFAADSNLPMPTRISDTIETAGSLLLAAVVFLIAWRGGDQSGNLVLALAFSFEGANTIWWILLKQLKANDIIRQVVNLPTFILGAGFFVLAAARFPRKLTPLDIESSGTIWGRIKPLRATLIFFLHAPAVWALVAVPAIFAGFTESPIYFTAHWFTIVLIAVGSPGTELEFAL